MQQQPSPNNIDRSLRGKQRELRQKQQIDESQVLKPDPMVHHGLCEKWQDQLNRTADQQADKQLDEQRLVGADIGQYHAQAVAPRSGLLRSREKVLGRLQQQQQSGSVLLPLAQPTAQEFFT